MEEKEQVLSKKEIYTGKYISLKVLTVEKPSKGYAQREIIEHSGTIAILFMDQEENIYLKKVYRKATDKEKYEIFTAKIPISEKEDIYLETIKKEQLSQISIEKIAKISQYYPSPKYSDEIVHLYLCKFNKTKELEMEFKKFSQEEAYNLIKNNEIIDSPSIIGLLEYKIATI